MAYTQNKTINTRISLKYDTYANWTTQNPILLKGEVAIATIPADTEVTTQRGQMQDLPNVVIKVGDGSTPYKGLKFVSALAADVYDWAKAAQKPTYDASEIANLKKFIEDNSDYDTDTQYRIVPVNAVDGIAYKYQLESKASKTADAQWTVVADSVVDLSDADSRLDSIEAILASAGLEGTGQSVAVQISTAINALNSKVTLEHGPVKLVIDEVNGKLNQGTSSLVFTDNFVHTDAYNTKMGELATAIADAKKAGTDAQTAVANETKTRTEVINALDLAEITTSQAGETITFIGKIKQEDGKVTAGTAELKFNSAYDPTNNKAATMSDVTSAVADLNGAMHFEGVSTTDPKGTGVTITGKPDYVAAAGDVVIYNSNDVPVEYVYDGSKWNQLGDEGLASRLIAALDIDDITVGADETLSVIGETDGKIHTTTTKIQIAESQVTNLEADLKALRDKDTAQQSEIDANKTAIGVINGTDTGKSMRDVANAVSTADIEALNVSAITVGADKTLSVISEANGKISATPIAIQIAQNQVTGLPGKITEIEGNIDTLEGLMPAENKTVDQAISAAIGAQMTALANTDAAVAGQYVTAAVQANGKVTVSRKAVNIAELEQTANTYVLFNCGTASDVISN